MPQPLQIGKDAGLGHLALEATQGGFDPFVFADGDLGHETLRSRKQLSTLATDPHRTTGGGEEGAEGVERPAAGTASELRPAVPGAGTGAVAAGPVLAGGVEREEGAGWGRGAAAGVSETAGQLSR